MIKPFRPNEIIIIVIAQYWKVKYQYIPISSRNDTPQYNILLTLAL